MSATLRKKRRHARRDFSRNGRRRIKKRLDNSPVPERPVPMMTATNIHYELADRVQGLSAGGIGAMFLLAQRIELDQARSTAIFICSRCIFPTTNPTTS